MMKNFTNTNSKYRQFIASFVLLLFGVLFLSSCGKEEDAIPDNPVISITNTSPVSGTFNVYVNDIQVNTAALPFGGGVPYRQYAAGEYSLKFTTASAIESLYTKKITLSNSTVYSFFLIDKGDKLDGLLLTDDLSAISTSKSYIRFINVSPDAPSLDLAITGKDNLITDKPYKAFSEFIEVDPGTYTFDIKDHATGTVKTTSISETFIGGGHYTILARGLMSETGTDHVFSAQISDNK